MAEQTLRLLATAYSTTDDSRVEVTNPSNAYTDISSSTYATVTNKGGGPQEGMAYFYGFDFSQIPTNAVITSMTFKIAVATGSTGTRYYTALYNRSTGTALSSQVQTEQYKDTYTLTLTSLTYADVIALGNSFAFGVSKYSSSYTQGVFGMQIDVTYDAPAPNKIIYNGRTLIDLTNDDTLPEDVTAGKIFHLANGEQATGTATGIEEETGTWKPTSDIAGASAPKIMFSNTHTSPPTLVLMATSTAFSPTRYAIFGTCLVNWEKLNVSFPVPSGLTTARYAGFITNYYSSTSVLTMVASSPITHSSDDTGSADNSYYRFHADKTGYKPYSSQANVFFKANVTYNWRALWI